MVRRCGDAHAGMSADEMARLIDDAPPGPWPDGWAGWDCVRDAQLLRLSHAIEKIPAYPAGRFSGRGIVSSVSAKSGYSSGKNLPQGYFPGAWVMAKELRRLGCTLPITFAHCGPLEWDATLTRLVEDLDIQVIDLEDQLVEWPVRILAGWEAKVLATLVAPYEEVLFLDADNIPLRDPTFLFTSAQYRYSGSIFWPDVPPYDREEWLPACVWRNVGLVYRDEVDFESGQYLIDKKRCWRELQITGYLNWNSDYFYRFVFGDKSTFHLAWARLGTNWSIPQRLPGGNQASLIQHDFAGQPLFQHCTRNKPSLGGYPSPGSLLNAEVCEEHVRELARRWNGRLWENPEPTEDERRVMNSLIGKRFLYEREGLDKRPIRFLADDRIGLGMAKMEITWTIHIDKRGPMMAMISIDGALTFVARPAIAGTWSGRWVQHERCPVTLTPIPD